MNSTGKHADSALPVNLVEAWHAAEPQHASDDFAGDRRRYAEFWRLGRQLIDHLPAKSDRSTLQAKAAESVHEKARTARQHFLRRHVETVYSDLTQGYSRFCRVEALVTADGGCMSWSCAGSRADRS